MTQHVFSWASDCHQPACFFWSYKEVIKCDTSRWGLCVFNGLLLFLSSYLSLSRVGQPRGQGDRDPCSGSSAPREEPTDAGAADETPGQVGGEYHAPGRLQTFVVKLCQTLCTVDTGTARWLILAVSPFVLPHCCNSPQLDCCCCPSSRWIKVLCNLLTACIKAACAENRHHPAVTGPKLFPHFHG